MINLNKLSTENLERIQKVLKIILDELEIQEINRLVGNKIPLKRFEKEGFSYEEIKTLLYGIDDKHDIISINNDYLKEKYEEIKIPGTPGNEPLLKTIYNVSVEDLKNYLLITIKDLNKLKKIKEEVDKKLKAFTEKRGKQETKTDKFNEEFSKTEQMLDELESDINEKTRIIESPAKYENGILKFRAKEIDFRRKQNQKDLLETLFKNIKKNWFYDEIQEAWDIQKALNLIKYPKDYWRKFYSAGDDINKAIAIETQIKDFIIKNTKQIRINEKYI